MLLDVANRKAGRRKFCGRRQARDSTADNENVQNLYLAMMPYPADVRARSRPAQPCTASKRADTLQYLQGTSTNPSAAPVPEPTVMPIDRNEWARQLNLSNFVNTYYQFRDLQMLEGCRTVLIVGPGQGLDTQVLRWRGYHVTTFDIDTTFRPDHVGSVHQMEMFTDGQFDAVIASHVLEHLPEPYFGPALAEIARVGKYALIYLPVAGRHFQVRLSPGFRGIDLSLILDLFNYFHRPSGTVARYCQRQHFWEVGMRAFRVRDVAARMREHFDVLQSYRNRDWNPSWNFVLRSKVSRDVAGGVSTPRPASPR